MGTNIFTILLFILALNAVAPVKSEHEDFSSIGSDRGVITSNHLGVFHLKETNELKSTFNASLTDLMNTLIEKVLDTKLGSIIVEALFDTPNFVAKVNLLMEKDVLILNGNGLRISFQNLLEAIKLQTQRFLQEHLRLNGLLLKISSGYISKIVDDFGQNIDPAISEVEITVFPDNNLQEVPESSMKTTIRKIILDIIILLMRPFQSKVDETLLNITNQLLSLYKPVLPNNYFQSIVACGINQSVLKAIELVETVRDMINGLFKSNDRLAKRSVDVTVGEDKKPRSLINLIVGPIRFLITLLLTPVHKILKRLMNYVFITLRPVVGQIILSPVEAIIMNIINLIPCSNC